MSSDTNKVVEKSNLDDFVSDITESLTTQPIGRAMLNKLRNINHSHHHRLNQLILVHFFLSNY